MAHRVNTSVEKGGSEVNIYADPDTLRAIADDLEARGTVWVDGHAIDVDEPAQIMFGAFIAEDAEDDEDDGEED